MYWTWTIQRKDRLGPDMVCFPERDVEAFPKAIGYDAVQCQALRQSKGSEAQAVILLALPRQ